MLLPIIFSLCMVTPISDSGCPLVKPEPLGAFPYCETGTVAGTGDYDDVRCLNLILEI